MAWRKTDYRFRKAGKRRGLVDCPCCGLLGKREDWHTPACDYRIVHGFEHEQRGMFNVQRYGSVRECIRHADGGWYEEDCEWAIPFLVFAAEILAAGNADACRAITEDHHRRTLKNSLPDEYTRFTGKPVALGESYKLRQRAFDAAHASEWVSIAAWGDWACWVPKGMVGVVATMGGKRAGFYKQANGPAIACKPRELWALVKAERYEGRDGDHGLVLDPDLDTFLDGKPQGA